MSETIRWGKLYQNPGASCNMLQLAPCVLIHVVRLSALYVNMQITLYYLFYISCFRMRNYKRKSERATKGQDVYELATTEVLEKGTSVRKAAKLFDLCHVSLHRYMKKKEHNVPLSVGYAKPRLIFTPAEEEKIVSYLLKCADIYFGLLPLEVRKLAYQSAVIIGIQNIPPSWHENKMAGPDWFSKFMNRNPRLSLRTPEATSLSRATSFNKTNVEDFFNKYQELLQKYNFPASRIWNIDETGITTAHKPKKFVAARGQKQVGAITSAERGTLVTLACAVNAVGNSVPPMFVFPRIRYTDIFVRTGPNESIGAGNSSGWMTEKEFVKFIDHFIKHVHPTEEQPVLLLLDNHRSHVNIAVVQKAKDNHIIMFSFPPHCSHHLQPLDVGVYGPFKNYLNRSQTAWMNNNPGKTMTIYDIPGIFKDCLPLAINPVNIMSGFKASGMWPVNVDIFQDSGFAPSYVTDRPNPDVEKTEETSSTQIDHELSLGLEKPELLQSLPESNMSVTEVINQMTGETSTEPIPGPSGIQNRIIEFSPSKIRPLPKASPRKQSNRGQRKRRSAVLTDTPEKEALENEYDETINKKRKQEEKGKGKGKGKVKEMNPKRKRRVKRVKKRIIRSDTDSETEEWFCLACGDAYSNSDEEEWVKYLICKMWTHVKCVRGNILSFVCVNCDSDED